VAIFAKNGNFSRIKAAGLWIVDEQMWATRGYRAFETRCIWSRIRRDLLLLASQDL